MLRSRLLLLCVVSGLCLRILISVCRTLAYRYLMLRGCNLCVNDSGMLVLFGVCGLSWGSEAMLRAPRVGGAAWDVEGEG